MELGGGCCAGNELPAALNDGHVSTEEQKSVLVPCGRVECGQPFLLGAV